MSIHDSIEKIKSTISKDDIRDIAIILIVIFTNIGSFLLGIWLKKDYQINSNNETAIKEGREEKVNISAPTIITTDSEKTISYPFIASKNGTKYYPKGCSGTSRIKPENIIGFENEEQAIASGRQKANGC